MTVYEQLTEYCDCLVDETKDEGIVPKFDARAVDELIHLISTYTCWAEKPCDTFLQGERKEVVDVPDCICDCDVFEFDPFYAPFDKDSFTFTLVEQNGIAENTTEVTAYINSDAYDKRPLNLPPPSWHFSRH